MSGYRSLAGGFDQIVVRDRQLRCRFARRQAVHRRRLQAVDLSLSGRGSYGISALARGDVAAGSITAFAEFSQPADDSAFCQFAVLQSAFSRIAVSAAGS